MLAVIAVSSDASDSEFLKKWRRGRKGLIMLAGSIAMSDAVIENLAKIGALLILAFLLRAELRGLALRVGDFLAALVIRVEEIERTKGGWKVKFAPPRCHLEERLAVDHIFAADSWQHGYAHRDIKPANLLLSCIPHHGSHPGFRSRGD